MLVQPKHRACPSPQAPSPALYHHNTSCSMLSSLLGNLVSSPLMWFRHFKKVWKCIPTGGFLWGWHLSLRTTLCRFTQVRVFHGTDVSVCLSSTPSLKDIWVISSCGPLMLISKFLYENKSLFLWDKSSHPQCNFTHLSLTVLNTSFICLESTWTLLWILLQPLQI